MPVVSPNPILVTIDRMATGGAGIANAPDGRIMMVEGGLPGDRVAVEVIKERKRLIQGHVVEVLESGPYRIPASCNHFNAGCGGCDWQPCSSEGATELRRLIVVDSLRRLGKIDSIDVETQASSGAGLPRVDYRTTVRAAVTDGLAGFRTARSNEVVLIDSCETAHPLAERILVEGRFPGATEVVARVGARTGECLLITDCPAEMLAKTVLPDEVQVITREQLAAGETAWIHEEVAAHRFRISADSFFQCRPDGAEALIRLVDQALVGTDGPMIDAYGGVGLFGATVGQNRQLTIIESNQSSVADARVNLHPDAKVVQSRVERWTATQAQAVVADPARRGLGKDGVQKLLETKASVIALVSCDPASLARDARLLIDAGFGLDWVTTVDMFGQTSHIETVSRFSR